jgi:hypothetical protein
VIDKANATGAITANAIASPYTTPDSGGYLASAVAADESQAWVGGWISDDSASGGPAFAACPGDSVSRGARIPRVSP